MISNLNLHITPAYAIEHEIDDNCLYVIISSGDRYDAMAGRNDTLDRQYDALSEGYDANTGRFDTLDIRSNVLVLHFADTEDRKRHDAIDESDVKAIVDFLEHSEYTDAFICCDEGVSRSPAICAGLLKCSGRDDDYIWKDPGYRPNVLVYRKVLEYFYPSKSAFEELSNMEGRSSEEYRYFRRNGRDLDYDKIINREVHGAEICYGYIYGTRKNVVLFVKVGRDGTVHGYRNKYLNLANHMALKYGITVIVSSNPFNQFKWKEALDDAAEVLRDYFAEQSVSKAKVLYYGHSDGASMIATYGKEYDIFDAFLLSNLPLPVVDDELEDSKNDVEIEYEGAHTAAHTWPEAKSVYEDELTASNNEAEARSVYEDELTASNNEAESVYTEATKIMLNMADINNTKPLILVIGEHDKAYRTYERISIGLLMQYGQNYEVHVLKNEAHSISEQVVKILPELFFDENVLIDKGLEQNY